MMRGRSLTKTLKRVDPFFVGFPYALMHTVVASDCGFPTHLPARTPFDAFTKNKLAFHLVTVVVGACMLSIRGMK